MSSRCKYCHRPARFITSGGHHCCEERAHSCPDYGANISRRMKKMYRDKPELRERQLENINEFSKRPEVAEKKSEAMKELHHKNPEFKRKYKKGIKKAKKTKNTPEYRKECSERMKKMHKEPEFRKAYLEGINKDFNRSEERIHNLLQAQYPGFFNYNWGDKFRVGRMRPDFFNEAHKIAIDFMGEFFHTRAARQRNMTISVYKKDRVKKFKMRGWKLHIIWGTELNNFPRMTQKISKFMEG